MLGKMSSMLHPMYTFHLLPLAFVNCVSFTRHVFYMIENCSKSKSADIAIVASMYCISDIIVKALENAKSKAFLFVLM